MRVEINNQSFDVPEDFVNQLADAVWSLFERMYEEKVDDAAKFGLMAVTRAMLVKQELEVRMKFGKEAAQAMRPPPKSDPNLWVARQYLPFVREIIHGSTLACETTGESITALTFAIPRPGSTGGQVDTTRIERVRQNDRIEIP